MRWYRATGAECTTAGCAGVARWCFVAGCVGSDYCDGCRSRITGEPDARDHRIAALEATLQEFIANASAACARQHERGLEMFASTLTALHECAENMDAEMSDGEARARTQLLLLCSRIAVNRSAEIEQLRERRSEKLKTLRKRQG